MARNPDAYTKFDTIINAASIDLDLNPWGPDGLNCEIELLNSLVARALRDGLDQRSGAFAKAFDSWAAVELRRAGFPADAVWPRAEMPRVLTRELATLLDHVTSGRSAAKSSALKEELRNWLATHDRSPKVAPTDAKVLGGVYRKQADVLVADWATGVELMISTKSMLGSYGKNLRNRFEESFGDAINLRQRFPLGAFGFLFVIDTAVPHNDFVFLTNMLRKLVDAAGYDATCLMLIDLDAQSVATTADHHAVPDDLAHGRFFETLVSKVVDRTPANTHQHVRLLRGMEIDDSDEDEG